MKIKKECDVFCLALGSKNWQPAQLNSMQASFYAGSLFAFTMFSEISAQENEDIAVTQLENLLQDINKNILEQKALMQKIWDAR